MIMVWGNMELAKRPVPKDNTQEESSIQSAWPEQVPKGGGGKQAGYFSAGIAYGYAQYQIGALGSALKMPWEITQVHHDPEDEATFAQGAAWAIMLASTRSY